MSKGAIPTVTIVPATEHDPPRMGRLMVETWLAAHRGQIPEGQWARRRNEWTPEVSANGWVRTVGNMRNGSAPDICLYLAVGEGYEEDLAGLVMAGSASCGPWDGAGEVSALYVRQEVQRLGIGRRLLVHAVNYLAEYGMTRLVIRCLDTNIAGCASYDRLGGGVVGHVENEDYGFRNVERIYGWEDATLLVD